ncbi:MAG: hypothetical protein WDO56_14845 [Gammaproteobacteria bacterium]
MNTLNRKVTSIAGLLALGLFSTFSINAAERPVTAAPADSPTCHQETRRVAAWPVGGNPKLQQIPRFETRMLTVCDHEKTMSKPLRSASSVTYGPRQR